MKDNKKIVESYRKKIFQEKRKYHKKLAELPIKRKIKILIELQKIAQKIKGKKIFVWKI